MVAFCAWKENTTNMGILASGQCEKYSLTGRLSNAPLISKNSSYHVLKILMNEWLWKVLS